MSDVAGARRRRTKIVATVGPASDGLGTLRSMLEAGMDVARLSLAHGSAEVVVDRIGRVRAAAAEVGRSVAVLADLPGPKIRTASFPDGGVFLAEGDRLAMVSAQGVGGRSAADRIAVDRPELIDQLACGDLVALGDGGVQLVVEEVAHGQAMTVVRAGGRLHGRPGVNVLPERVGASTPTADDLRLLERMCEADVDAVAISFVRHATDVDAVRAAAGAAGPMLVAKIETRTAVEEIDQIIEAADGVMVARGDLGVRWPLEDVPHLQKQIIRKGVAYGRPVITATQMLESMVHAPTPTRAEVTDIANAVFDGTSALMLSAESAIGRDPVDAVRTMARIAERAEREFDHVAWGSRLGRQQTAAAAGASAQTRITSAITAAAWRAAADCNAAAIICCTRTGHSARAIARFRPTAPLLAFTPSPRVARQLCVSWGVTAIATDEHGTADDIVWFAVQHTVERGVAAKGDIVVVLVGSPTAPEPTTDVLRLVRIC